jgi:hypothetical protein
MQGPISECSRWAVSSSHLLRAGICVVHLPAVITSFTHQEGVFELSLRAPTGPLFAGLDGAPGLGLPAVHEPHPRAPARGGAVCHATQPGLSLGSVFAAKCWVT